MTAVKTKVAKKDKTKPKRVRHNKSDMVIYKSANHKIFKNQKGNRPVLNKDLKTLQRKIEEIDLLQYHPILVNEKLEVIDGQHRLKVAKILKLTIYYMIIKEADLETTKHINVVGINWSLKDFMNSYVELGNKHYIELKKYMADSGGHYSTSTAIGMFTGGGRSDDFKHGGFEISENDRERATFINDIVQDFKEIDECLITKTHFLRFVNYMYNNDIDIMWERLKQRCIKNHHVIRGMPSDSVKVRRIMEELYNHGLQIYQPFSKMKRRK